MRIHEVPVDSALSRLREAVAGLDDSRVEVLEVYQDLADTFR